MTTVASLQVGYSRRRALESPGNLGTNTAFASVAHATASPPSGTRTQADLPPRPTGTIAMWLAVVVAMLLTEADLAGRRCGDVVAGVAGVRLTPFDPPVLAGDAVAVVVVVAAAFAAWVAAGSRRMLMTRPGDEVSMPSRPPADDRALLAAAGDTDGAANGLSATASAFAAVVCGRKGLSAGWFVGAEAATPKGLSLGGAKGLASLAGAANGLLDAGAGAAASLAGAANGLLDAGAGARASLAGAANGLLDAGAGAADVVDGGCCDAPPRFMLTIMPPVWPKGFPPRLANGLSAEMAAGAGAALGTAGALCPVVCLAFAFFTAKDGHAPLPLPPSCFFGAFFFAPNDGHAALAGVDAFVGFDVGAAAAFEARGAAAAGVGLAAPPGFFRALKVGHPPAAFGLAGAEAALDEAPFVVFLAVVGGSLAPALSEAVVAGRRMFTTKPEWTRSDKDAILSPPRHTLKPWALRNAKRGCYESEENTPPQAGRRPRLPPHESPPHQSTVFRFDTNSIHQI